MHDVRPSRSAPTPQHAEAGSVHAEPRADAPACCPAGAARPRSHPAGPQAAPRSTRSGGCMFWVCVVRVRCVVIALPGRARALASQAPSGELLRRWPRRAQRRTAARASRSRRGVDGAHPVRASRRRASSPAARSRAGTASAPLTIEVTGHQWWWEVQYDDADRRASASPPPTRSTSRSGGRCCSSSARADVIHSFWVPNLARQAGPDPRPRRQRSGSRPTRPGVYRGQCAEFCGHAAREDGASRRRRAAGAASSAWLRRAARDRRAPPTDSLAQRGQRGVPEQRRARCATRSSGTPAGGSVGPRPHAPRQPRARSPPARCRTRRGNLAGWIVDPQTHQARRAACRRTACAPHDLQALLAYLESLK